MAGRRGEEKWELVHSALEERQEGLPTRFEASLERVRVAVVEAGMVGGRRLEDFRLPQIETWQQQAGQLVSKQIAKLCFQKHI